MSSRPVYRMCAQVAPSAEYLRGHGRVAVDVTALHRLWQHSPVLGLVVTACVPVCAVLRGSLLCNSCGLSAVKINEELLLHQLSLLATIAFLASCHSSQENVFRGLGPVS